jgi:hypothetical protein
MADADATTDAAGAKVSQDAVAEKGEEASGAAAEAKAPISAEAHRSSARQAAQGKQYKEEKDAKKGSKDEKVRASQEVKVAKEDHALEQTQAGSVGSTRR